MKRLLLINLALLLLLSACIQDVPQNDPDTSLPAEKVTMQTGKVDYNPNPNYTPDEVTDLSAANNQFAFELYQILAADQENLVFSPYSLFQALVMVYAGAEGNTASQFEQVLHLPVVNPEVHRLMNALNIALTKENPYISKEEQVELNIANAVWVAEGLQLEQIYLDTLSEHYAAGLRSLDFADAQKAADLINAWAAEQTNDKIKDIAKAEMFSASTILALTNAVYFKGSWMLPFDEANTYEGDFTLLSGETKKVPTMVSGEEFGSYKDENYQIVQLPYIGSSIVMDLIAPTNGDWETFSKNLTVDKLNEYLMQLRGQKLNLSLPKFRVESGMMDLIEPMQNLGMTDVFSGKADLSGITGDQSAYVSTLVQKAYIDVNEAGTEAAAVTLIVVQEKGMIPTEPVEMRFDKPFLFLIRDMRTGAILFIGQLMQP
ncbi:MAG: serpin family protein [Anaerolineaceae bacterium]|nr:serpin family protein [Anaerolineaceae bacterium]MDD4043072.1 serpin family protein [Anaerolineaceae bacterium]MDD4576946.1 serpin family protein [Anaerolineaceae bacterium]